MIALIQRVSQAKVEVNHKNIGHIGTGILLFLGVEKGDAKQNADNLLHKVINYRIFEDDNHKMNCSLRDINGELLIVPQFTLPANTQKGTRPSFASAAPSKEARLQYEYFVNCAKETINNDVETGEFGADMQVSLINNGPVTFWLQK